MKFSFLTPGLILSGFCTVACTTVQKDQPTTPVSNLRSAKEEKLSQEFQKAQATFAFLLGETLALRGQKLHALAFYEAAYKLDPNSFLASKALGARAGIQDPTDELLAAAKGNAEQNPNASEAQLLYGTLLMRRGQRDQALKILEQALAKDPSLEGAYLELIAAFEKSGERAKSIGVAKRMTKKLGKTPLAWTLLARLYLDGGAFKDALLPSQYAYELDKENPECILVHGYILAKNQKVQKGMALWDKWFANATFYPEVVSRTSLILRSLGPLDRLASELNQWNQGPDHSSSLGRVFVLWQLQGFEQARKELEGMLKQDPRSPSLLFLAGLGGFYSKNLDQALAYWKQVSPQSKYELVTHMQMASLLLAQQKPKEAKGVLLPLLRKSYWEVYGLLGEIYAEENQFEEAIRVLDEGVQRFPQKTKLLFLRGVYEEKNGEETKCIQTMKSVIAKDPEDSGALNYLGYLYAERGESLQEAEDLLKRALSIKINDPFYLDSLGWIYFKQGKLKEAQTVLEEAIRLAPEEGVIWEHLGALLVRQKNQSRAREAFNQALKYLPKEEDQARIKEQLDKL